MALRQKLQFSTTGDGVRIALASAGSGPPLVRASHWLSHVEHDLESPVWSPWIEELSRNHTYVRYDQRGCGLSDRDVGDISLEAWVRDLEAVVDDLGLERFPLIGMSQGGAIAIEYARRHPEQISHLILINTYARGVLKRGDPEAHTEAETLVNLMRLGWGRDNPAFRQVFTNLFIPGGTPEQQDSWTKLERISASAETAARTLQAMHELDVTESAGKLTVPATVFHCREDSRAPFSEGRLLASLIPDARFVPLEGRNHVLLTHDDEWPTFLGELRGIIGDTDGGPAHNLTLSEVEVLALLAKGLNNAAIADALGKSEKTVRNQLTSIYSKLDIGSRAEAILRAQDMKLAGN